MRRSVKQEADRKMYGSLGSCKSPITITKPGQSFEGRERRSTSRSKSPLQCAEMVFGDITNLDRGENSPETKTSGGLCSQSLSAFNCPKPGFIKQQGVALSLNYQQMSTEELLRAISKQSSEAEVKHNRSKTVPEMQNLVHRPYQIDEDSPLAQLRQENMILSAEKSNIQAELVFYKNELAKLCLRHGSQFPVYRPPEPESAVLKDSCLEVYSAEDVDADAFSLNPSIFYKHKKQISEGRYVSTSHVLDDAASTTLSQVLQSKSTVAFTQAAIGKSNFTSQNTKQASKENSRLTASMRQSVASPKSIKASVESEFHSSQDAKSKVTRQGRVAGVGEDKKGLATSVHQVTVNLDLTNRRTMKASASVQDLDPKALRSSSKNDRSDAWESSEAPPSVIRRRKRSERNLGRLSQLSSRDDKATRGPVALRADKSAEDLLPVHTKDESGDISSHFQTFKVTNTAAGGDSSLSQPMLGLAPDQSSPMDKSAISQIPLYEDNSSLITPVNAPTKIQVTVVQQKPDTNRLEQTQEVHNVITADNDYFPTTVTKELGAGDTLTNFERSVASIDNSRELSASAQLEAQLEQRQLSAYVQQAFTPLKEKERKLQDSHKELQEKLAKIKQELLELSAEEPSIAAADRAEAVSQGRLGSTLLLRQEVTEESAERSEARDGVQEGQADGDTSERKQQFEQVLSSLRQRLQCYNEEEQRVMKELEVTRTLRKEGESDADRSVIALDQQSEEDSFQLRPRRLVFETCSQKSQGIHHSPLNSNRKMMPFTITDEASSRGATLEITGEAFPKFNDEGLTPEAKAQVECRDRQINIIDCSDKAEPIHQPDETLTSYQSAAAPGTQEPGFPTLQGYISHKNNAAMLQFSQIIEEEHESESNAETSNNHSRCTSSVQFGTHHGRGPSIEAGKDYSDFVAEAKQSCKMPGELQGVSERSSLAAQVAVVECEAGVRLFDGVAEESSHELVGVQKPKDSGGLKAVSEHLSATVTNPLEDSQKINTFRPTLLTEVTEDKKANTMQRFEKLIQDTIQSDEGSLLRHIQRNLEQMQSMGDLKKLKQQRSPGTIDQSQGVGALNKKYLESSENDQSMDTQRLLHDYQQQVQVVDLTSDTQPLLVSTTQMSETIQFMANAGQTGTTIPQITNRSSAQDEAAIKRATDCGLPQTSQAKSRNPQSSVQSYNSSSILAQSGYSAPSFSAAGACQIKILSNPKAAETMSSGGGGPPHQLSSYNSIDQLSKASPYFQEHSTFELTKQFQGCQIGSESVRSHQVNPLMTERSEQQMHQQVSFQEKRQVAQKQSYQEDSSIFSVQSAGLNTTTTPLQNNFMAEVQHQLRESHYKRVTGGKTDVTGPSKTPNLRSVPILKIPQTATHADFSTVAQRQRVSIVSDQQVESEHQQETSSSEPLSLQIADSSHNPFGFDHQQFDRVRTSSVTESVAHREHKDQTGCHKQSKGSQDFHPAPSQKDLETLANKVYNQQNTCTTTTMYRNHRNGPTGSQTVNHSTPKSTQLLRPVRQTQQLNRSSASVCDISQGSATPLAAPTKTDPSSSQYNIYKRNSVKRGRLNTASDLNQGVLLRQDVSDTMVHHAASQSTLNLDSRSPFTHADMTPKQGIHAVQQAYLSSSSDRRTEKRQNKRPSISQGGPLKSQNTPKMSAHQSTHQQAYRQGNAQKYEASYQDYINNGKNNESFGFDSRRSELSRNKGSEARRRTAGLPNQKTSDEGVMTVVAKSRSVICLNSGSKRAMTSTTASGTQRGQQAQKPSPSVSKRLSNISRQSNAQMNTAMSKSGHGARYSIASGSVFATCRGGSSHGVGSTTLNALASSSNNSHINTSQVYQNNQRAIGSSAAGASQRYLTRLQGGGKDRTGSATSGEAKVHKNVVLFTEPHQAYALQGRSTPSYMQPIQQKFKKQTLDMVKEQSHGFSNTAGQDRRSMAKSHSMQTL